MKHRFPPVVTWVIKYHHPKEPRTLAVTAPTLMLARMARFHAERAAGWWRPVNLTATYEWYTKVTKITFTRQRKRIETDGLQHSHHHGYQRPPARL